MDQEKPSGMESLYHRDYAFLNAALGARDKFQMIANGKIERIRKKNRFDSDPGERTLTINDARIIAAIEAERINVALNAFSDSSPKQWQFDTLYKACQMASEHLRGVGAQTRENVLEHITDALLKAKLGQ